MVTKEEWAELDRKVVAWEKWLEKNGHRTVEEIKKVERILKSGFKISPADKTKPTEI